MLNLQLRWLSVSVEQFFKRFRHVVSEKLDDYHQLDVPFAKSQMKIHVTYSIFRLITELDPNHDHPPSLQRLAFTLQSLAAVFNSFELALHNQQLYSCQPSKTILTTDEVAFLAPGNLRDLYRSVRFSSDWRIAGHYPPCKIQGTQIAFATWAAEAYCRLCCSHPQYLPLYAVSLSILAHYLVFAAIYHSGARQMPPQNRKVPRIEGGDADSHNRAISVELAEGLILQARIFYIMDSHTAAFSSLNEASKLLQYAKGSDAYKAGMLFDYFLRLLHLERPADVFQALCNFFSPESSWRDIPFGISFDRVLCKILKAMSDARQLKYHHFERLLLVLSGNHDAIPYIQSVVYRFALFCELCELGTLRQDPFASEVEVNGKLDYVSPSILGFLHRNENVVHVLITGFFSGPPRLYFYNFIHCCVTPLLILQSKTFTLKVIDHLLLDPPRDNQNSLPRLWCLHQQDKSPIWLKRKILSLSHALMQHYSSTSQDCGEQSYIWQCYARILGEHCHIDRALAAINTALTFSSSSNFISHLLRLRWLCALSRSSDLPAAAYNVLVACPDTDCRTTLSDNDQLAVDFRHAVELYLHREDSTELYLVARAIHVGAFITDIPNCILSHALGLEGECRGGYRFRWRVLEGIVIALLMHHDIAGGPERAWHILTDFTIALCIGVNGSSDLALKDVVDRVLGAFSSPWTTTENIPSWFKSECASCYSCRGGWMAPMDCNVAYGSRFNPCFHPLFSHPLIHCIDNLSYQSSTLRSARSYDRAIVITRIILKISRFLHAHYDTCDFLLLKSLQTYILDLKQCGPLNELRPAELELTSLVASTMRMDEILSDGCLLALFNESDSTRIPHSPLASQQPWPSSLGIIAARELVRRHLHELVITVIMTSLLAYSICLYGIRETTAIFGNGAAIIGCLLLMLRR